MEEREIEDDERMNINLHLRSHPLMSVDLISGEFITNPKNTRPSSNSEEFFETERPSSSQKQVESEQAIKVCHKRRQSSNLTLDSLIGQANLVYARGKIREAITYLHEAIKLFPYGIASYRQLSDIYSDLGQAEKSFEFRLLSSLLSQKTTAIEWEEISVISKSFGRMELAVASLAKAIRADPTNWIYYEKRIQLLESLGDIELAMKTRLQAAQSIDCRQSNINFSWIDKLIKTAADYFCTFKDENKATEALETFILRSREFGRPIEFEHLALLSMWVNKGRYEDSLKSILALHPTIRSINTRGDPTYTVTFTNVGFVVSPFPPDSNAEWLVDNSFNTLFLSYMIICFIHIQEIQTALLLIKKLLQRNICSDHEAAFIDVARALQTCGKIEEAILYVESLKQKAELEENADIWYLYGLLLQNTNRKIDARISYEKVLKIQPGHIDARINLSTILQQQGDIESALDTLKDVNLESCTQLPDERLLVRQADVLLGQGNKSQYINCLRMLLIPHFYVIHRLGDEIFRSGSSKIYRVATLSPYLKQSAFEVIKGGELEKVVKRLGYVAFVARRITDDLTGNELHDYALRLAEGLFFQKKYKEMLHVVCYAFLHPKIIEEGALTFQNLLYFASIKAEEYSLAFEFTRFYLQNHAAQNDSNGTLVKRIHLAMNFVLCRRQHVNYHRFVMRQLFKNRESIELRIISGNNSLVTGSYRHALGEYYRVWLAHQNSPLLTLLVALTFAHIACKKDISSRHLVALRAIAFMKQYQKLRGRCQEVDYNIGRILHQMGILSGAIYFYERALCKSKTPKVYSETHDGEEIVEEAVRYDLRRQTAYNLSLIYEAAGNRALSRNILEEYCTI